MNQITIDRWLGRATKGERVFGIVGQVDPSTGTTEIVLVDEDGNERICTHDDAVSIRHWMQPLTDEQGRELMPNLWDKVGAWLGKSAEDFVYRATFGFQHESPSREEFFRSPRKAVACAERWLSEPGIRDAVEQGYGDVSVEACDLCDELYPGD